MHKINLFAYGLIISIFILQGCSLKYQGKGKTGAIIGNYWVPLLPDWKKNVRKKEPFSNITYTHIYKNDVKVILKFVKFPSIPQKIRAEYKNKGYLHQVKKEFERTKQTVAPSGIKMTLLSSSSQSFQGLPSVALEITLDNGTSFSIKRVLRFIEKRDEYYLELTTTRKDKHYLQSKEGLKAWNHIIKGLKPVHQ